MPFKKKKFPAKLEARLDDLASQTEEPVSRSSIVRPAYATSWSTCCPTRTSCVTCATTCSSGCPDSVADKVPDKVKPKKRSKLKRVAFLGVLTGARRGRVRRGQGAHEHPAAAPEPFPAPPTPTAPADVAPRRSRRRRLPPRSRESSASRIPGRHARGFVRSRVNIAGQRGMPSGHCMLGGTRHDDRHRPGLDHGRAELPSATGWRWPPTGSARRSRSWTPRRRKRRRASTLEVLHDEIDVAAHRAELMQDAVQVENATAILEQTEHVLDRLDLGLYGICEECSASIGRARLEAFRAPRAA